MVELDKAGQWLKIDANIYDYIIVNDKYFIGRYDVMFGTRVRGGELFGCGCSFDVCCGTSRELADKVIELYSKKVIQNYAEGLAPHAGLKGMSKIKPIHKDLEYMKWLSDLEESLPVELRKVD